MKKLLLPLLLILFSFPLFSEKSFSPVVEESIKDFFTLRMTLSLSPTPEAALEEIAVFKNEHKEIFTEADEEEKLTLQNLYELEEYNYENLIEENSSHIKKHMQERMKENENYITRHKGESFNKWFLTTSSDVLSVCMSFDPLKTAVKYGLTVKKRYEEALVEDGNFSYALTNLAQWYYFAPHIAGGGKHKAKPYFEKALEKACSDAEKYYALIFLSQTAFDEGKKERCELLLNEADAFVPGGKFIARLKAINKKGHSYFSRNSSKYE